jgi:hypothetical protein
MGLRKILTLKKMVGLISKVKKFFSNLPEKIDKAAYKYALPFLGTVGDVANSSLVQAGVNFAAPWIDTVAPGWGTGLRIGTSVAGKVGDIANQSLQEDWGGNFGITDFAKNVVSGKYGTNPFKDVVAFTGPSPNPVPKGINLAKRPDTLHSRIQLKALPSGDEEYTGSFVEELD